MNKKVIVAIANQGQKTLETEKVKEWVPTEITNAGDSVYFKHEDTYYSMKRVDFKKIFNIE